MEKYETRNAREHMRADSSNSVDRITASELAARLEGGERVGVLDVRGREAWSAEPDSVPGAVWLPLEEVPQRARDLPKDTHLIIYCS